MTKNEFVEKLAKELAKRGVADAADIEEEYRQHFAFKLADGYSEEEIAAKLGDPAKLAAQFGAETVGAPGGGKKAAVVTGLVFLDIVTALGFIALAASAPRSRRRRSCISARRPGWNGSSASRSR